MGPFGAGATLHRPTPPDHISSAHLTGRDGARIRMNVAAYQKNEKTGKTQAGEEIERLTNFKEAACYPSVVVQRAAQRKKWFLLWECPG